MCEAIGFGDPATAVSVFAVGNGLGRCGAPATIVAADQSSMHQLCREMHAASTARPCLHFISVSAGAACAWRVTCHVSWLGRLAFGLWSDIVHARRWFPRPLCLTASMALMSLSHLLLMWSTTAARLYLGVFAAAFAFGGCFTLTVVVSSELWGLRHHGSNYMLFDGAMQVTGPSNRSHCTACPRCDV